MIVGNGMLARAFAPRYACTDDVVVFASGVSNSNETRQSEFDRERELLRPFLGRHGKVVYFSSCGVEDAGEKNRPYMKHKQEMEALVLAAPEGYVIRLPQVVGLTPNPNTLTNFLSNRIRSGEPFTVWSRAQRNLVDVDDIASIGSAMIESWPGPDRRLSIAAKESLSMPEIVAIFERVLGLKANCTGEDKGSPMNIEASEAARIGANLGIDLGKNYAERVIRKYYGAA